MEYLAPVIVLVVCVFMVAAVALLTRRRRPTGTRGPREPDVVLTRDERRQWAEIERQWGGAGR